jgi:hypothetical protein
LLQEARRRLRIVPAAAATWRRSFSRERHRETSSRLDYARAASTLNRRVCNAQANLTNLKLSKSIGSA